VFSWRGDSGVCVQVVEKKKYSIHDYSIQAGKLGGGDSASMIVTGNLRFLGGEFFAGGSGADSV